MPSASTTFVARPRRSGAYAAAPPAAGRRRASAPAGSTRSGGDRPDEHREALPRARPDWAGPGPRGVRRARPTGPWWRRGIGDGGYCEWGGVAQGGDAWRVDSPLSPRRDSHAIAPSQPGPTRSRRQLIPRPRLIPTRCAPASLQRGLAAAVGYFLVIVVRIVRRFRIPTVELSATPRPTRNRPAIITTTSAPFGMLALEKCVLDRVAGRRPFCSKHVAAYHWGHCHADRGPSQGRRGRRQAIPSCWKRGNRQPPPRCAAGPAVAPVLAARPAPP